MIDVGVLVEPLQWTATAPGQAVVDFLLLFGDVDVHRALLVAGRQYFADLLWRDRAQRVETHSQGLRRLLRQDRLQACLQAQVVFRAVDKAPLAVVRCQATKPGVAVEHRQQGQAYPRGTGRLADLQRQFGRVGIGLTSGIVMHIWNSATEV